MTTKFVGATFCPEHEASRTLWNIPTPCRHVAFELAQLFAFDFEKVLPFLKPDFFDLKSKKSKLTKFAARSKIVANS
nr:hypothetical protein [Comamonas thiooxydans]